MRVPTSERRRRSFRIRGWMIITVVLIIVVLFSLRGLAGFYTDYLWFDSVGLGDTWRGLLAARFVPAVVFTVVFFVIMFGNLFIADRIAPHHRAGGSEDEFIERYQRSVAPYSGRIRIGVSLFFALIAGVGVSSQWRQWILFRNRVDFGIEDPQFGLDIGFYVFQLPFLQFIANWLFAGLVIVLIVTAIAHYLNGGIRLQRPFQRVTPQVKAHLSVILGMMALVKTAQYVLARYELNFSHRGVVDGAGYTDVEAQLPALNLLIFISVTAAILFLINIRLRGWVLPVIAVGLWGFVSLVVGTIYPAAVQQFRVKPNEFAREEPYIERNIDATRQAFDLDNVQVEQFDFQADLDAATVDANLTTINNARLWDPAVIQETYQTQQGLQTYYGIDDVDVDRYQVGGETRQVLVTARELNSEDLPSQSWINRHIVYTHGYGAVASPTNRATRGGEPEYFVRDIPPIDEGIPLTGTGPEIYFGEDQGGYVLVDAESDEFNYPREDQGEARSRYDGDDGVPMSNLVRRAAFALRFGDINPLISGQVTDDTKIIFERDIMERVEKAAPFLEFDADPYPVVIDGRVTWVLDAYTTSNDYPYSQTTSGSGGLSHDFNYVRNSVKATIDAYDGDMTFYVLEPEDPMIQAYQKAFPELFTDFDEMPDDLRAHLRYPEDLFTLQSEVFGSYHVTKANTFYQGNAKWLRSPDPNTDVLGATDVETPGTDPTATNEPQAATSTSRRMDPYYLFIKLPGDQKENFLILQPFVPVSADNAQTRLSSFMTAKSDPEDYGTLQAFEMPQGRTVQGPVQVDNAIRSEPDISRELTLLDQRGSQVIPGSLQLIPVGNSIIYIRPYFVQGQGESSFPEFRFVVVFTEKQDENPVLATSVQEGLNALFPELGLQEPDTVPDDGTVPPPDEGQPEEPSADVQELLDQAASAFADAEVALMQGDLAEYQRLVNDAADLVEQARELAAAEGGATEEQPAEEEPANGSDGPTGSASGP
ncbi:MAG: UPF0182 family protein [Acidimicrobiia bacterium]